MGVLALLVEQREQRIDGDRSAAKTELILARVGMSPDDIAAVMGKNKDAVRMVITRAKAA
jgi:DNA-directed RNA polymerase specialized sigma24 family protein